MCPTLARRKSGELPCPLVSLTRSWVRKLFEGARTRRRNSKGCGSIPSRSENFGETRRSFLIFPCGKGIIRCEFGFSCPGADKKNRGKFGPNTVPFRRISEQNYCIQTGLNSQGETVGLD